MTELRELAMDRIAPGIVFALECCEAQLELMFETFQPATPAIATADDCGIYQEFFPARGSAAWLVPRP